MNIESYRARKARNAADYRKRRDQDPERALLARAEGVARAKQSKLRNPEHNKKWRADRFQATKKFLADYKLEKGCEDCGYNKDPVALDFDHVRGDKLFTIGQSKTRSLDALKKEIAKCVVRCSNCHRVATRDRIVFCQSGGTTSVANDEQCR